MDAFDELCEKFAGRSPAFEQLFEAEWSNECNVEPNSKGFTTDDVEALLEIATDRRLDGVGNNGRREGYEEYPDWDDEQARPPFQALHAILRLVGDIREKPEVAKAVCQAMAAWCARTKVDDAMCDILPNSIKSILVELGPTALTYVLQQLHGITVSVGRAAEAETRYALGTRALLASAVDIAIEAEDLALSRQAASGIITFLTKMVKLWGKAKGHERELIARLTCDLAEVALKLGPLLSNEAAIAAVRCIILGPHADTEGFFIQSSMDWLAFLGSIGLECSPADPALLPNTRLMNQAPRAIDMWRSRRGDPTDSTWPTKGPFPGEPGYQLPPISPEAWASPWCCGAGLYDCRTLDQQVKTAVEEHLAQWDKEHPLPPAYGKPLSKVKKAHAKLREEEEDIYEAKLRCSLAYTRSKDELWKCSSCCKAVLYCSEQCQAARYSDASAKRLAGTLPEGEDKDHRDTLDTHVNLGGVELEGALKRLVRVDFDSADQHRYQCKLLRAIWADAGVAV